MAERSEKAIMNDILLEMSSWDQTIVFRNNTGMAWQGEQVKARKGSQITIEDGMIILRKGRPVTFGLEGSSDIIGCSHGMPLAIEVKAADGKQRDAQKRFQTAWEKAGGKYVLTHSVKETHEQIFNSLLE